MTVPLSTGRRTEGAQFHVPELDGVRGIAILMVVLLHFGARPPGVPKLFTAIFGLGWSGVDLFFVLSGFLITGILLDTRTAPNYFSSFYVRRILRIFPLYYLSIIAYFRIALPAAHYLGYWSPWAHSPEAWYWCYLANWPSVFGPSCLLGHFWSLAIEEQFYFFWPLVVFVCRPSSLKYVCLATMGLSFGLRCAFLHYNSLYPGLLYSLTPFRLEPLACGGLVAAIVRNPRWRSAVKSRLNPIVAGAGLALLFALAATRSEDHEHPLMTTVGFTAFSLMFGCLVFHGYIYAGSNTWLARQLRRPALVAFGKYSYAMYVFHAPISFYQDKLVLSLADHVPASFHIALWASNKIVGLGVSYAVALLSWHVIEKRFLRLKQRFIARPMHEAEVYSPA